MYEKESGTESFIEIVAQNNFVHNLSAGFMEILQTQQANKKLLVSIKIWLCTILNITKATPLRAIKHTDPPHELAGWFLTLKQAFMFCCEDIAALDCKHLPCVQYCLRHDDDDDNDYCYYNQFISNLHKTLFCCVHRLFMCLTEGYFGAWETVHVTELALLLCKHIWLGNICE